MTPTSVIAVLEIAEPPCIGGTLRRPVGKVNGRCKMALCVCVDLHRDHSVVTLSGARGKPRRDLPGVERGRLQAARLFAPRVSQAQVARKIEVTSGTASRWYGAWMRDGEAGLARKGPPGLKPRLFQEQLRETARALFAGRSGGCAGSAAIATLS